MIQEYTVSSKSRQIFRGDAEYLLVRFSQLSSEMKEAVLRATTPVDIMDPDFERMYYSPGKTYLLSIPLFLFFNEHVSNALDVNFSEEVHIDITFRPPSELFFYGNIGDVSRLSAVPTDTDTQSPQDDSAKAAVPWDQSTEMVAADFPNGAGTAHYANWYQYETMMARAANHIRGVQPPLDKDANTGPALVTRSSRTTFAFPNVDNNGDSVQIQLEGLADFIVQDTDAYRALRAQMFPEGSGLTTITYNTSHEVFQSEMTGTSEATTILSEPSGGTFRDPASSASGIVLGDRYLDVQLTTNNLVFATHFMVRYTTDVSGGSNEAAFDTNFGIDVAGVPTNLGAHRIYTRAIPIHYFQLRAAGRVLYESQADSHVTLTQSGIYNGTGQDFSGTGKFTDNATARGYGHSPNDVGGRPLNIYTLNFGLQGSRLENTGSLSYQNLNNPTLRIYFKPSDWHLFPTATDGTHTSSEAQVASRLGLQIDVIHEHWNVLTINSGNGEITSGLNQ
jgi:hypothetical protein